MGAEIIDQRTPITLNLSLEKVNVILGALGELPAKISFELIGEVRDQVMQQVNQPPATVPLKSV